MKIKVITFLIVMSLIPINGSARPSKLISEMMATPASVFDVYLLQLRMALSCAPSQTGNPNEKKITLCLTSLTHDYEDNLVKMEFYANSERLKAHLGINVDSMSQESLKRFFKTIMLGLSRDLGLEKLIRLSGSSVYSGIIQKTPIRNDYVAGTLDESAVKEEIRRRTNLNFVTDDINGFFYHVERDHHGSISVRELPRLIFDETEPQKVN